MKLRCRLGWHKRPEYWRKAAGGPEWQECDFCHHLLGLRGKPNYDEVTAYAPAGAAWWEKVADNRKDENLTPYELEVVDLLRSYILDYRGDLGKRERLINLFEAL